MPSVASASATGGVPPRAAARWLVVSNGLDAAGRGTTGIVVDVVAVVVLGAGALQMGLLGMLGTLGFLVFGIPVGVLRVAGALRRRVPGLAGGAAHPGAVVAQPRLDDGERRHERVRGGRAAVRAGHPRALSGLPRRGGRGGLSSRAGRLVPRGPARRAPWERATILAAQAALVASVALHVAAFLDQGRAAAWLLAGGALWGVAIVVNNVTQQSVAARVSSPDVLGRVMAFRRTLTMGVVPGAMLGGGALGAAAGPGAVLAMWLTLAVIGAVLAAVAVRSLPAAGS